MKRVHWYFALGLVAATLLGAGLRFYKLDAPSLWADEMFQLRDAVAGRSAGYIETRWGMILAGVDVWSVGPEEYHAFQDAGMTEWNTRLGGAVMGILAIPLLGLVSSLYLGLGGGFLVALLLALNSWHVEWSQHARFYSPMFLYYNGALACYFAGVVTRRVGFLAVAMILAFLAVDTKPTSLMLFGVIAIDLLVHLARNRRLDFTTPAIVVLLIGGAASFGHVVYDILKEPSGYVDFLERRTGVPPWKVLQFNIFESSTVMVVVAGLAVVMLIGQQTRTVVFLAAAAAVPLIAFGVLAFSEHVEVRYTFMNLYGWIGLAAMGLAHLYRVVRPHAGVIAGSVATILVVGQLVVEVVTYYGPAAGDRYRHREAFRYVDRHRESGDPVIAIEMWAGRFYLEDTSVVSLDYDFPESVDVDEVMWFVIPHHTVSRITEAEMPGNLDLLQTFPNRVPWPYWNLYVYKYTPKH